MRGMVLAAGYGSRLAPLTDHVPKPLLPVGRDTILDHAVDALLSAGIEQVAVNTHHLGEQVAAHLQRRPDGDRFTIFPEKEILGTGGALHGARAFLAEADHFVIHNGDVWSDADLAALVGEHLRTGALATLLLVDYAPINSVAVDGAGAIRRIGGDGAGDDPAWRHLTYTGIGVFRRELLDDIGPGFSSLMDPLVRAKEARPGCVRGLASPGLTWSDLGTPARYLEALPAGEPSAAAHLTVSPITGHGSDRRFWRLQGEGLALVAMVSPAEDLEFQRFCDIAGWLHGAGLGAPALVAVRPEERSVLMEDLGHDSLFNRVRRDGPRDHGDTYHQVLEHLVVLQQHTQAARRECPPAVDRILDEAMLGWETDYFRERFLLGHCGLREDDLRSLEPEFAGLARVVAAQPLVLLHRDFQSQNIHFKAGRVRLVDVQGMRLGPLGYDAMSVIMDPYADLSPELRRDLLEHFVRQAVTSQGEEAGRAMCLAAGLQRVMQALGAYGFLGHVKGKRDFLEHIPAALRGLCWLLEQVGDNSSGSPWLPAGGLPILQELLEQLEVM